MEGGYILDAELLKDVSDAKRGPGLYSWLRQLDKAQETVGRSWSKEVQETLRSQLLEVILGSGSPPIRTLASKVMVRLFCGGETIRLFETINALNDVLSKNKDDLPTRRLGAISCLGIMYADLGRLTGRSYEETSSLLVKGLKSGECITRVETMNALGKISGSLGSAAVPVHRDIYKSCRLALTDRAMSVKTGSALCLLSLSEHATFLHTSELENIATLCFRAMDGANYEARKAIAKLLGTLIAKTLIESPTGKKVISKKSSHIPGEASTLLTIEEAFTILGNGFIKGGSSSGLIKGGSPVSQDVRVGISHSYVVTVTTLGGLWLEKNHNIFLTHILELVSHPKASSTHVDAVYSRRCAGFIIRTLLGKLLGEKSQLKACEDLINMVARMVKSLDIGNSNGGSGGGSKDSNSNSISASSPVLDSSHSQHALYVALTELGFLLIRLGTSARSLVQTDSILTSVLLSVLIHPSQAPRLAAAWCLRCLCIAVPSHLTPTIDKCLEGLDSLKTSPEAIAGYSSALAALLGAVRHTPLGIPHTRGKVLFNVGEELLRTASQNSRLSRERTQAGWHLIGAIMTLGSSVVKGLLPRMMLLWRNAFPRSLKELESEKARGDAFTWKISLEARAGALATIHSFLQNCPELLNEDIRRRICVPVESALTLLGNVGNVLKSYQSELKALSAMLRLRLFETLSLLPPSCLESSFTPLLRLLVAEFTLTDGQSNAFTSLLPSLCHSENSILLGTRFQDTEDVSIEDQLLFPNSASGSVALEHDICSLYRKRKDESLEPAFSLPLGVAVVDIAIVVYGVVFPRVAQKHRVQMLNHFMEQLKQTTKTNARTEAIHLNIFSAILSGLKGMVDAKVGFGNQEDVKSALSKLILGSLTSQNPLMRCVSAEALGRMAQVVSDSKFVAEMAQNSFDCLKSARDVVSRTGHSLALGCLHHYVGGMGSSQHLHTSVSILLALAQDSASPQVQVWSLHALALIADSGGPMFRSFVEPTLSTILKLLIIVQSSQLEVMVCLGRVLSALITTVGPELQGTSTSITTARSSFLVACTILQNHGHSIVEAEAISSLQQLHMFAPSHVDLATLVPNLCRLLCSNHFVLRASAVSCLRQFAQREAKEVCEHALTLLNDQKGGDTSEFVQFKESGLPGVFFSLLDLEVNGNMISNIHDTLNSVMQSMAAENLTMWLSLLREVLTVSTDSDSPALDEDKDEDADDAEFNAGDDSNKEIVHPRWPTRVFAAMCLRKIISECCQGDRAHYDLGLAKEMQLSQFNGGNDYLVLHLSELVRVAFMAATSESDPLRLEGLKTLEVVIEKFGDTQEPEFPGHVILEQYQAQVGAALRPAFSSDTASHVTSSACDVCSCWIGSGVARDLNDLRRVYQLLVGSLEKLRKGSGSQIYNESALTLEKLSILKAWAEVYIVSMKDDNKGVGNDDDFEEFDSLGSNSSMGSLATLVQSELSSLSKHWIAALRDYALLSLPPEFKSQLPYDGGAFYTNDTIESARPHYRSTWPQMLQASAIWLTVGNGFCAHLSANSQEETDETKDEENNMEDDNNNRFHLIFGVCIEALSNSRCSDLTQVQVTSCLIGLKTLLDDPWCRSNPFLNSPELAVELCNVLHRTILTRDRPSIQILVMDVLISLLEMRKFLISNESSNGETEEKRKILPEGGTDGKIEPGQSVVFASLEVCLCILIRHYPDLSTRATNLNSFTAIQAKSFSIVIKQQQQTQPELITRAISALSLIPDLCSPSGALTVLPSVLYLLTGVLIKESKALVEDAFRESDEQSPPISASITAIKNVLALNLELQEEEEKRWEELLSSSFAQIIKEYDSLDEHTLILCLTLLIIRAPTSVTLSLKTHTLDPFKKCLRDDQESRVKLRCIQALQSVFQHPQKRISHFYIVSLSPRLFQISFMLHSNLKSETDLRFLLECHNLIESLIVKGGSPNAILQFLIPALVNQLLSGDALFKCTNKFVLGLHDKALNKLTLIGQKYPSEFKDTLGGQKALKNKLETALKDNQLRFSQKSQNIPSTPSSPIKNISGDHQVCNDSNKQSSTPSIKLSTDFSNFVVK
ncbi:HEAT repeat-containing protein 5B [Lepeophtheirus salmonis]|uniref:HEAT repeat-containing protein 5B n=1 Tax=Lepeophtheirus salmonis TaxID=72036 RepID=A0A0K2TX24_LEPSM|nr:HEAT repeat-containing protein 5B-like [Lepeophtheirus salmonis]